jgi:hypothetical protein
VPIDRASASPRSHSQRLDLSGCPLIGAASLCWAPLLCSCAGFGGGSKLLKSSIASALKVTTVLPHCPCPRVTRLCSFGLQQAKTRMFEVLESPVPSSQFRNEGAHTQIARHAFAFLIRRLKTWGRPGRWADEHGSNSWLLSWVADESRNAWLSKCWLDLSVSKISAMWIVKGWLRGSRPDWVVVGGRIARSFTCDGRVWCHISVTPRISSSTAVACPAS